MDEKKLKEFENGEPLEDDELEDAAGGRSLYATIKEAMGGKVDQTCPNCGAQMVRLRTCNEDESIWLHCWKGCFKYFRLKLDLSFVEMNDAYIESMGGIWT